MLQLFSISQIYFTSHSILSHYVSAERFNLVVLPHPKHLQNLYTAFTIAGLPAFDSLLLGYKLDTVIIGVMHRRNKWNPLL